MPRVNNAVGLSQPVVLVPKGFAFLVVLSLDLFFPCRVALVLSARWRLAGVGEIVNFLWWSVGF